MYSFLLVIFIIDVVLLIPVIMMQSGSGAEAGMFGSDLTMGAFGAKTSEVLVNFTKWLVVIFMVSAFLLGYIKVMETKAVSADPRQDRIETTDVPQDVTEPQEAESEADTLPVDESEDSGLELPGTLDTLPLDDAMNLPLELP